MVFIRLVIFIAIGIVLGIMYNKFVLKFISGNSRKILCILAMVIFIFSSISISVAISVKSFINSTVENYSSRIEQFIFDTYPSNDFVINGIDLNKIVDVAQINTVVSGLREMIPSHSDLNINKRIYDMIIGVPAENLFGQINDIDLSDNAQIRGLSVFADKNNIITVSSIMNYLTTLATGHINIVFFRIFILLLMPFCIYVVATLVNVIRVVKKEQLVQGKNGI